MINEFSKGARVQQSIDDLREQFLQQLSQIKTTHDLENFKIKFLGKKGTVQQLMQVLRGVLLLHNDLLLGSKLMISKS